MGTRPCNAPARRAPRILQTNSPRRPDPPQRETNTMTPTLATSLSALPEYRRALFTLVARDLKVKYQTKALGFLWSLVYPAMMIAIWYAVFRGVLKVNLPNYWAY